MGRICYDTRVSLLGRVARQATRKKLGAVIVAASTIGSWHWCPRKAWHDTTLFNSGWLPRRLHDTRLLEGLAGLWEAQLARSRKPSVRRGRRIHGEYVGAELEIMDSCSIVESGVYGLLDPESFEKQLVRYKRASDPVEYHRAEDFPLIARRLNNVLLAGVPDGMKWGENGLIVYELKTTGNPERFFRGPGLVAALHQLTAYTLILSERWGVEKAVLEVRWRDGRQVISYDAEKLIEKYGESVESIARRLASGTPPEGRSELCRSCEYSRGMPECIFMEADGDREAPG